jgi:hypothetical protein
MIHTFSSSVAKQELSKSWVTQFTNRHKIHFISKWTTAMNHMRHLADSESKCHLYFELLHQKITQYKLEAQDIYNMDEKGFLIGVVGRSKWIFSKRMCKKKGGMGISPGWMTQARHQERLRLGYQGRKRKLIK